jgi:hypothetical protein
MKIGGLPVCSRTSGDKLNPKPNNRDEQKNVREMWVARFLMDSHLAATA